MRPGDARPLGDSDMNDEPIGPTRSPIPMGGIPECPGCGGPMIIGKRRHRCPACGTMTTLGGKILLLRRAR